MADVFAGVTPAGGASPAPTAEKLNLHRDEINRAMLQHNTSAAEAVLDCVRFGTVETVP
jgi:hypothetical protein